MNVPHADEALVRDAGLEIEVCGKDGHQRPWTEVARLTGDLVAAWLAATALDTWQSGLLVGGGIYWTSRHPDDFNSDLIERRAREARERRTADALMRSSVRLGSMDVESPVFAETMRVELYASPAVATLGLPDAGDGFWMWIEHSEHAVCFMDPAHPVSQSRELRSLVLQELRRQQHPF